MKKTKSPNIAFPEITNLIAVTQLPDGSAVYRDYLIRQLQNSQWGLFKIKSRDLVEQFSLKTCALMAARARTRVNLNQLLEISQLDSRYDAAVTDVAIFKHNLSRASDRERYLILLGKLEHSELLAGVYRKKISQMFKRTFV